MQSTPVNITGPAPSITQTITRPGPRLYLAGPIADRTDFDCKVWRDWVKQHWPGHCYDPLVRDIRHKEMTADLAEQVVQGDLYEIRKADAVLVRYDQPSVGTSMEIFYAAHQLSKPVFLVNASQTLITSPWLIHFTHRIFNTLNKQVLDDIWAALKK